MIESHPEREEHGRGGAQLVWQHAATPADQAVGADVGDRAAQNRGHRWARAGIDRR